MRKILIQILKIVVSALLIYFLLRRVGVEKVLAHFGAADMAWVVGAVVLFMASHLIGSCQWWLLLREEDIRLSWRHCLSFYFIGLFFNNFFIGSLGGDIFRMMDIRRYSKNGTGAVSTVFLDRFLGLLVLSGMAVVASPWVIFQQETQATLRIPLVLLVAGWTFCLLFIFSTRFARPFVWLIRRIFPMGVMAKGREVYLKVRAFCTKKRLVFRVLLISAVVQSLRIMTHYALARSLGIAVHPVFFFIIIPLIAIMASLPISLGGIGMREQTGVLLFGLVGVPALLAFSVEFMAYLTAVLTSLPGGIVFLTRKGILYHDEKYTKNHES